MKGRKRRRDLRDGAVRIRTARRLERRAVLKVTLEEGRPGVVGAECTPQDDLVHTRENIFVRTGVDRH